jgi:hypothetical protein
MLLLIEDDDDVVYNYEGCCWMSEGSSCQDKDVIFHLSSTFAPCSTLDSGGIEIDIVLKEGGHYNRIGLYCILI